MVSKKTAVFLILSLYLLPSFIQANYDEKNNIKGIYAGFPIMQTGDEPHYYATLYSIVNDGDVFLTNNYNNALYRNGSDLGTKHNPITARHTRIYDSKNKTITNLFVNDTILNFEAIPKENSCKTEISGHPMGLPLFASVFLWPFKNTQELEHLTIYLTIIVSLAGLFAFYKTLLFYHKNPNQAIFFTIILAFGTQYWHYSKTFFAEPYLASFLIIAYYLTAVRKNNFIAGFLLGCGFLMKYPFLLTIFPFYTLLANNLANDKDKIKVIKQILFFSLPLAAAFLSALFLNYSFTNNFLKFNQMDAVFFTPSFKGIFNWLFNPTFGLLTFSPILIFAFFGVRNFWNKNKINTILITLTCLIYFIFWAFYGVTQDGAGGYSARYLVPILPQIVILCSFCDLKKNSINSKIFYLLLIASILINFLASFAYPAFITYPIQTSFMKLLKVVTLFF